MSLKITSAEFFKGAVKPEQYPNFNFPEFAFFGRSNVGKSSLINMIVGRKGLVKTGAKPGKTREVNFFLINRPNSTPLKQFDGIVSQKNKNLFCLTDLPGYGYAKLSGRRIQDIDRMLFDYCTLRQNLSAIFFLLDMRREPSEVEKNTKLFFDEQKIPVIFIGTKADKLAKNSQINKAKSLSIFFDCPKERIIITSTLKKIGKDKILSRLSEYINQ
ncbi:MAG: ribosome biogenesis GTP-binding protein YsxC [Treponema sp.]|nr:MAG: ribosome biogenesis GTP-binding protein YsxC [Treponema sp.]